MKSFGVSDAFNGDAVAMALLGGAILGCTVGFKTGVIGEVLGVSGSTRGLLMKPTPGKFCFVLGLVLSGVLMNAVYGGFDEFAASDRDAGERVRLFLRLGFGGIMVGFGTALGNGCTSGHGLTRLTLRSWAAVPCFMVTAMLAATAFGTATDLVPKPRQLEDVPELADTATWAGVLVALLLIAMAVLWVLRATLFPEAAEATPLKVLAELVSGLIFGCGLALSTMSQPIKVAGFLDWGSGAWDPSLAFVMGGALCITFPFFQLLERRNEPKPLLGGSGFGLPPKGKPLDWNLFIGTAMFGAGWGTCGMCPGPIWVCVGGKPSPEIVVAVLGMLLGMGTWVIWQKLRARAATKVEPISSTPVVPVEASEPVKDEHRPASAKRLDEILRDHSNLS